MKSQITLKKALLTITMVFASAFVFAQGTGKIAGTVKDKKTGETLIGVSVKLAGTTKGVGTDIDGKYTLGGLATGKHTIEISYVSYATKKITDVEVKAGAVTTLNVVMEESTSQTLNQVVITGSYKQESVNALYALQKNSAAISDGISSDIIKKSPDKNTSDVLKRVSGASIQDNKFVVIRGMSDRYNTALLDHAELPSTEPNRKAFSFDIVPSSLVDNLVINKTATPDLPGNFTGGAIQIMTKDVPDKDFLSVAIGAGYNTVSTFNDFYSGPRSGINYLGFDKGGRKLPDNFPSSNAILYKQLSTAQNIAAIKSLPNDWNIYNKRALPAQSYQVSLGKVKNFEGNRKFGAIVSLSYRNSQTTTPDLVRNFHVYNFIDNQYKFSTSLGALANFAYSYGNSKITLKNIYNKVYDDNYLNRLGSDISRTSDVKYYAFDLLQKTLLKSTLEGTHKLSERNDKLNWSVSFDDVLNDQPDQRKAEYLRGSGDQNDPNGFSANVTGLGKANARLFSNLHENGYSGALNYSLPLNMFSKTATLKTGLSSQYRDRNFDVRFLGLVLDEQSADANDIRKRPLATLFADDLINNGKYRLDELQNLDDKYTANTLNNAAYAMLDNKFGEKFRLVWGIRAEQFNVNLAAANPLKDIVEQRYLDVLPSANLTYSLTTKSNLRASYSRTLARPELRELAPFQYYDYELLANQEGNTKLKRALIDNVDLRYEFYPAAGQIISVSAFYKNFTDAIESSIDDVNSTPTVSYFNSKQASAYGIEFEIRKNLDFISEANFFKNTTIYTNLALIKSDVKNNNNPQLLEKNRPMVGQAPYLLNAGIQHNLLDDKIGINLLYNKVGRKIYKAGGQQFPSVWENPRDVIDFQLSYKVTKKAEFKFNAGDILNQKNVLYFDKDGSKSYNPTAANSALSTNDQTIASYKLGSNYSLSFSYTF